MRTTQTTQERQKRDNDTKVINIWKPVYDIWVTDTGELGEKIVRIRNPSRRRGASSKDSKASVEHKEKDDESELQPSSQGH